jgi:hypothetical protein
VIEVFGKAIAGSPRCTACAQERSIEPFAASQDQPAKPAPIRDAVGGIGCGSLRVRTASA